MRGFAPVALLLLVACARPVAPGVAASTTRATLPLDLAALVPGARLRLGPFAWPRGGTSAVVEFGDNRFELVWHAGAAEGHLRFERVPLGATFRDVTGDGVPELVFFSAPHDERRPAAATTLIYRARSSGEVERMEGLEIAIAGVRDEASLDPELASLGRLGPTSGVPLERILVRLGWATSEELRALLHPNGIEICEETSEPEARRCTRRAKAAIDTATERLITSAKEALLDRFEEGGMLLDLLGPPDCFPLGRRVECGATSVRGPWGVRWLFEESPAGWKVVEVTKWRGVPGEL
jgi:hypothetical protein